MEQIERQMQKRELKAQKERVLREQVPDKIPWSPESEEVFHKLKGALTSSTVMRNPDFSQPFTLQTDASEIGLGAVLHVSQNEDFPIAYYSRKLLNQKK